MLNNAAIFIVSYLIVFYIYQLFTLIPAFALQIPSVFHTGYIDFDSVTSSASADVWQDKDNIFAVFGTSPLVIAIFVLFNILILTAAVHKLNYSLSVFCFWNIVNGILRFLGNFISGHIFYLWSSNLITDFLGLSYPSKIGTLLCVIVALIITFLCITSTVRLIKYVFNPFTGAVKEKVLYYILLPVLIGILFLYTYLSIPKFNENEFGIFILTAASVYLIYFMTNRKYKNIKERRESMYVKFNRPLIISVLVLPFIKIITDRGISINASVYRQYIIEMFLLISFSLIAFITLVSVIYYFHKRRKIHKQKILNAQNTFIENNADINNAEWGIKKHDMDKYKDVL